MLKEFFATMADVLKGGPIAAGPSPEHLQGQPPNPNVNPAGGQSSSQSGAPASEVQIVPDKRRRGGCC